MMDTGPLDPPGHVHLGSAPYSEAKRMQSALALQGIALVILARPEACDTKNCAPKLELFVPEESISAAQEFIRNEQKRDLGDLEVDPALLAEVFDSEKDTARCPACGESFSTRLTECPGCGLGFGVAEPQEPEAIE